MLNHPCIFAINPLDHSEWPFGWILEFSWSMFYWEFLQLCSSGRFLYNFHFLLRLSSWQYWQPHWLSSPLPNHFHKYLKAHSGCVRELFLLVYSFRGITAIAPGLWGGKLSQQEGMLHTDMIMWTFLGVYRKSGREDALLVRNIPSHKDGLAL